MTVLGNKNPTGHKTDRKPQNGHSILLILYPVSQRNDRIASELCPPKFRGAVFSKHSSWPLRALGGPAGPPGPLLMLLHKHGLRAGDGICTRIVAILVIFILVGVSHGRQMFFFFFFFFFFRDEEFPESSSESQRREQKKKSTLAAACACKNDGMSIHDAFLKHFPSLIDFNIVFHQLKQKTKKETKIVLSAVRRRPPAQPAASRDSRQQRKTIKCHLNNLFTR